MTTKIGTDYDFAQNAILNALLHPLSAAPSSPGFGQVYCDTTLNAFGVYLGAVVGWVYVSATTGDVIQKGNSGSAGRVKVSAGANTVITDYTGGAGLLKSDANGVASPAVAGTDYLAPGGNGSGLTGLTQSQISGLAAALALLAPLASPALTGTPTTPIPTTASGIANKSYVDSAVQGLDGKPSCNALAAGNITLSGTQTVDGVALTAGMRCLAAGQTTASQNGPWVVAAGAWTRPADFASGSSQQGAYIFVESGTTYGSSGWFMSGAAVTVDTSAQTWTQFSGAGEITVGPGLALAGNEISVASGGLPVAQGGTGAATVAGAKASLSMAQVYNSAALGNGAATTITVTHNLNNPEPLVMVYDVSGASPAVIGCDITATSANAVQLGFGSAPAANSIKCVVVG